jgi:hypothetical protein
MVTAQVVFPDCTGWGRETHSFPALPRIGETILFPDERTVSGYEAFVVDDVIYTPSDRVVPVELWLRMAREPGQ